MGSRKSTIASTEYSRSLDDKGREINDASLMQRRLSESDSSASSLNSPLFANSSVSSGSSTTTVQPRSLQVSLPSSWYTSENFFALETRAIFSQVLPHLILSIAYMIQAWHCVTHSNRFRETGTYYRYHVGTYPIFLIRSKDGIIRGFHNICRHRGYPVVAKNEGCSTMIGCRYHGWSYNSKGELVKVRLMIEKLTIEAPSFDKVGEFEKKENSLFPVHVHVTEQGLVFVNLSADPNVTPFEVHLTRYDADISQEYHHNLAKELSSFDFKDFELLSTGDLRLIAVTILIRKRETSIGRLLSMDIKNAIVHPSKFEAYHCRLHHRPY